MPKYAYYSPASNPSPVYGWFDTDAGEFPNLPAPEYLVEVTPSQWIARNDGAWMIQNRKLMVATAVSLPAIKVAKIAELSAACQATIFSGFNSSALGAAHHYPATDRDQSNLAASVLASILPGIAGGWTTPFWCADGSGNWAHTQHTAAQIQQVGTAALTSISGNIIKNTTLAAQVNACSTVVCVAAIIW